MIKQILAAAGLGLFGYVVYTAYTQKHGISADDEGGFMDAAIGTVTGGFMKVANFGESIGMNVSAAGVAHIKGWEGFRANVYLDSAGLETIGYGHLIKPTENLTFVTDAEATRLLVQDLSTAEQAVNDFVSVPLSQFQFDALVSFVFNVGRGAFARSTLLKEVNKGNAAQVKKEFMRWVYAGGKKVQGLVNRRVADSELWAAGSVA